MMARWRHGELLGTVALGLPLASSSAGEPIDVREAASSLSRAESIPIVVGRDVQDTPVVLPDEADLDSSLAAIESTIGATFEPFGISGLRARGSTNSAGAHRREGEESPSSWEGRKRPR